jgi:hypothetical protein
MPCTRGVPDIETSTRNAHMTDAHRMAHSGNFDMTTRG